MRLATVLALTALFGVSWAGQEITTGASRTVPEIAADFEHRLGKQEASGIKASIKSKAKAPVSETTSQSSKAPKSVAEIYYPLPWPAAPPNSTDEEVWELLQAKHSKIRQAKQELQDLIQQRDELLIQSGGSPKSPVTAVAAIIRAMDSNMSYKPFFRTIGSVRI